MHLSLSLSQDLQQLTRLQQTLIQSHRLKLRLALIQEFYGERYKPDAKCPQCGHDLTPVEIIAGFNKDTQDFTTCCPSCGQRFQPVLICFGEGHQIELPFYCGVQTLAKMYGMENLKPEQFLREAPAVYRSAITHYGSISSAFEEIGVKYKFDNVNDWENKIIPFLGCLPDTIIAKHANVSVQNIRSKRRKLGISRYTARKILNEIE